MKGYTNNVLPLTSKDFVANPSPAEVHTNTQGGNPSISIETNPFQPNTFHSVAAGQGLPHAGDILDMDSQQNHASHHQNHVSPDAISAVNPLSSPRSPGFQSTINTNAINAVLGNGPSVSSVANSIGTSAEGKVGNPGSSVGPTNIGVFPSSSYQSTGLSQQCSKGIFGTPSGAMTAFNIPQGPSQASITDRKDLSKQELSVDAVIRRTVSEYILPRRHNRRPLEFLLREDEWHLFFRVQCFDYYPYTGKQGKQPVFVIFNAKGEEMVTLDCKHAAAQVIVTLGIGVYAGILRLQWIHNKTEFCKLDYFERTGRHLVDENEEIIVAQIEKFLGIMAATVFAPGRMVSDLVTDTASGASGG